MNKIITVVFLLISFYFNSLTAQIAIGTESVAGVLRIQGEEKNIKQDVVVTDDNAQVRLGIGTTSPQAVVDVVSTDTGKAFRLQDGSEKAGYILESNKNGFAHWTTQSLSSTSIKSLAPTTNYKTYPTTGGHYELYNFPIAVAGDYLVIIRWWGYINKLETTGDTDAISAYFRVSNKPNNPDGGNSGKMDEIEYYLYAKPNVPFTFTTVLVAKGLEDKENLYVYIRPFVGGSDWIIGAKFTSSGYVFTDEVAFNPSIVIYNL